MNQPNLTEYDLIAISSSGGKDSQAMMSDIVKQADLLGISRSKLIVIHADLGRVEWTGTREIAEKQAEHFGLRFEAISRPQGDLLDQVEHERKLWPSSSARYCTSDHKRGQIFKVFTKLTKEIHKAEGSKRRIRILDCWGIRAEESPARAKKDILVINKKGSNGKRLIETWLPIHTWTEQEVWNEIKESGAPHHYAYDLGMPRLSCCFCVMAGRNSLLIAAEHNPDLLDEYIRIEEKIQHDFKHKMPIKGLKEAIANGERGNKHMISIETFECDAA